MTNEAIWDAEDDELLAAINRHLELRQPQGSGRAASAPRRIPRFSDASASDGYWASLHMKREKAYIAPRGVSRSSHRLFFEQDGRSAAASSPFWNSEQV